MPIPVKPDGNTDDTVVKGGNGIDSDIALSATIIIIRETDHFPETLMVQRSARMGFAAKAVVFPGGKVDKADHHPDWATYHDEMHVPQDQRVTRLAALRELFEETGIILARRDGELLVGRQNTLITTDLDIARREVHGDASRFLDFLSTERLTPALDVLTLFAQWRTPPALHRRFDTWFFVARMPEGQEVFPDGDESTEAIWGSAKDFLKMGHTGERKIIFPTARNLELLAQFDGFEAIISDAQTRRIECIEPVVVKRDKGTFLTIPDNLGYPITEEALETALRT